MWRVSDRVPRDYSPNSLQSLLARKRRDGAPILDLTETNPTRAGLPTLRARSLAALCDTRAALYHPDPRGLLAAREAIATYYRARGGNHGTGAVDPSRIILTSSTSEAYAHLFRLLCEPGDEILVPQPSYPLIEPLARLEAVRLRGYRLAYGDRWTLDFASLEASLTPRTRAIVVVEPNNPTGSCFTPQESDLLEAVCEERRLAIISDEVFGDFPWPARGGLLPTWTGRSRVPTFVLNGISKLCGLPQMKVAWVVVAGPEEAAAAALQGLEWIADLFLSVGAPAQLALHRFLEGRPEFQSASAARIRANLTALAAAASDPAPAFSLLAGDGGWCAILRFAPHGPAASGPNPAEWALAAHNVLLHPGEFYGLPCEEDAVLSLLTEPAVLMEALGRIRNG
jgi:aspartate/methionine/tyrosine aminotransferase